MVLPGELIPFSQKRTKNKTPTRGGEAAQRFAAQQKREDEAGQQALAAINQPPAPEPPEPHNGPVYDDLAMDQGNDPADSSVGKGQQVVANRSDYYRDPTYQEQTLREEAHWQAVLPKVFLAFMPCSRQTYQWCDPVLWNQDFNSTCKCKNWQKRIVVVDAVDFTSRMKLSVEVCDCTSDLVRLIRLGYMGSSPVIPRTAFSIRLLRFHHTLWKYSSVRLSAFTDTMDEYLDPRNPLFQVPGTEQTRDLRRSFSSAVDAYREMLRMEEVMLSSALCLTPMDDLAGKCPSCFGPKVPGKRLNEPDHIICLDANFQQRRHLAASAAWRGDTGILPSLFLSPVQVLTWKRKMGGTNPRANAGQSVDDVVDPCSAQHTAANDSRGGQTWRGCDETGLMGMACRHDILLKFINIVQSGECGYYPLAMLDWILQTTTSSLGDVPRFGILYDIGCNMEKSIIKREFFLQERRAEKLKFGTSVFHSYVHQWAFQLKYNPRLNDDWGLSDGEGLERVWASLASLVGALRYSTKAHRLCALALRTRHTNEGKRKRSITWLMARLESSKKLNEQSIKKLNLLQSKNARYTKDYFKDQWTKQRESQLRALVTEDSKTLNQKLNCLVELEEQHRKADNGLKALRAKRRGLRTVAEKCKIGHLPETLLIIDAQIDELVDELGGDHYRDMPGTSTAKGRLLIRIRVSKTKLYGAKVDVFESQRRNDEREGTRMQQSSKKHLRDKQKVLRDKYNIFSRNVEKFNVQFTSPQPIECPVFEDINRLPLTDNFWDIGQLTHPGEAWAEDPGTRDGIQAYLELTHSQDELRRVGRECRQSVKWALELQDKFSVLETAIESEDVDTETVANQWLAGVVRSTAATATDRLDISKKVLTAICARDSLRQARLCMDWNVKMKKLIDQTKVYSQTSEGDEELIKLRWAALLRESRLRWKVGTESEIVDSTPLDETEVDELNLGLLDLDVNDDDNQLNQLVYDDIDGDCNMGQGDDGGEGEVY